MFYDASGALLPAFSYPGNCFGVYYYDDNGTWLSSGFIGYNVWTWVVVPFTNEVSDYPGPGSSNNNCDETLPVISSVPTASWPSVCPSASHILGTFALINFAVALGSLILGHQQLVHALSCKLFGKEHENPNFRQQLMQRFQLFIPLGLHLSANAIITILIAATPDYKDGFTFSQLFLFLAARPRVTWIFALWVAGVEEEDGTKNPRLEVDEGQTEVHLRPVRPSERGPASDGSGRITDQNLAELSHELRLGVCEDNGICIERQIHNSEEMGVTQNIQSNTKLPRARRIFLPYVRFVKGQLLAEIVLIAMASYSIGSTAHFASESGFYNLLRSENLYQEYGVRYEPAAKMMYAAAIWWMISFPVAFLILVLGFLLTGLTNDHHSTKINTFVNNNTFVKANNSGKFISVSVFLLPSLWLGQWLWLAGFVKLMGPLYCPPKLTIQASIWIISSIIGITIGAGFG